jgi:hypothetical protein
LLRDGGVLLPRSAGQQQAREPFAGKRTDEAYDVELAAQNDRASQRKVLLRSIAISAAKTTPAARLAAAAHQPWPPKASPTNIKADKRKFAPLPLRRRLASYLTLPVIVDFF